MGKRHVTVIDGLRGVSILGVLLHHYAIFGIMNKDHQASSVLMRLCGPFAGYGHWSVHLFLIISGYCLYLPIARRGRPDWGDFYRRRVLRIMPAYLVAFVIAVMVAIWYRHMDLKPYDFVAYLLLIHHLPSNLFFGLPPAVTNINGSFWTLSLEAQLYMLMPLVLWVFSRKGPWAAWIGCVAIALAYRSAIWFSMGASDENIPREIGASVIARMPEFVLGAVIAHLYAQDYFENRQRPWKANVLILMIGCTIGAVISQRQGHSAPFTDLLIAGAAGSLAVLSLSQTLLTRVMQSPVLVWFGLTSYSIYLLHQPMVMPIHRWWLAHLPNEWIASALGLATILSLTSIFYYSVERPALKLKALKSKAPSAAALSVKEAESAAEGQPEPQPSTA